MKNHSNQNITRQKKIKRKSKRRNSLDVGLGYLCSVSHRLRSPISVILGTVSMFRDKSVYKLPRKTQEQFIENIYKKTLELHGTIENILAASEMSTKDFAKRLNFVPVQIEDLIKEVYKDSLKDAKKEGLFFTYKKSKNKLSLISADKKYLKLAIANLIDNAIQYTKEGGKIEITARKLKDNVIIKIKDTGMGIPKKDTKGIFKKFYRASNATTTYTDYPGLGLFIVKKVLDLHPGAKMSFKSKEGNGTCFTLSFPIVR
ncbi:hypothetical protein COY23_03040 [bacterium (Candidatus Torokbacteria) CG_4_10_14_0_2_um_filter_35_8]|nr:MAG: hypothetical protein COY23_03040 [bacterium (Candidatus Torokbacteria) CG_4_10_14_0_2_um_filter_35_8]